ncbi:hypothetical protein TNCV_2025151 [Trichonephila clavipes]|nr:hypothetical protein TNCV_2025151 [Trichonephila clavipes]
MFTNVSPIRHTAQIKSTQTFFGVSEEILATSASVMCRKYERSAGAEERTHDPLRTPSDKSHMASDRVNVEAMKYKLYREAICGQSIGRVHDEAHFWLNGYVNKQNCRIWSEANPQVYVETPLHPEKLTVWCALWAGGILLQKRRRPQRYSEW